MPGGPKKIFGDRPPPHLRLWMSAPRAFISRSGSGAENITRVYVQSSNRAIPGSLPHDY